MSQSLPPRSKNPGRRIAGRVLRGGVSSPRHELRHPGYVHPHARNGIRSFYRETGSQASRVE